MIILVTGTRRATFAAHGPIIRRWLLWAATGRTGGPIDTDHELWDGAAEGADEISHVLAREDFGWRYRRFPADWGTCAPDCSPLHRKISGRKSGATYCPSAGRRRNAVMVAELAKVSDRKACAAFPLAVPGPSGTAHCLDLAWHAGIPTLVMPLSLPKETSS